MPARNWVKAALDRRGVRYEEVHHLPAYTSQQVAQREHVSGHRVAKVVVAVADHHPVELVLPATRQVELGEVKRMLGANDVRLATEEEIEQYFADAEPGAVPPIRHWKDVDVWMDESMRVSGEMLVQAGTHTDAVKLTFDDWFKVVRPRVGCFSVPLPTTVAASPRGEAHEQGRNLCSDPEKLSDVLGELIDLLHLQAKELDRLIAHVEQHTDRMIPPSQIPLVVSGLSALHTRFGVPSSS